MKIKRIEHIAIAVRNLGEMTSLLQDKLGLELEYTESTPSSDLAMFPIGETYIELLEGTTPQSGTTKWMEQRGQSLFHICIEVEDIRAALDELRGKGVKLLDEEPRPGHGGTMIAFIDPASTGDIMFELVQVPEGAAHA
ncbi:MAG: VOC family protein [Acetobacterales bacterium]